MGKYGKALNCASDIVNIGTVAALYHLLFFLSFSSVTQSCPTLQPHESQHSRPPCPSSAPLSFTICQHLLKLMSIESVMPSSHLIHCHTLLLLLLNLSQHQDLFQCVSSLHQLAKALELQLQHQSFQWISFKIDCFDLVAVQETLESSPVP